MKAAAKKILVRWIILEAIMAILTLSITPFLFGSIKPFNPLLDDINSNYKITIKTASVIALKRAVIRKTTKPKAVKAEHSQKTVVASKPDKAKPITEEPAKKSNKIFVEKKGEIKTIQMSIHMEGTHYLEVNGKLVAILKSKTLNLNDYVGKDVIVSGAASNTVTDDTLLIDVQNIKALKSEVKKVGTIKKIENSMYMQGTHFLELDGKIIAILNSNKINLNQYVDQNVEVSGLSSPSTEGSKIEVIQVSSISIQ